LLSLERDITEKQNIGVTTFKQLQLQARDELKIKQKNKHKMERYYGKFWNELCNNDEEEI